MNMAGKNGNDEPQKGSEDPIPYHPTNTSSDWQLNGLNLTNTSACSSASIVDSFCAPIWDQPINGQNLSYCDVNMQNDACNSSNLDPVRAGMNWNPNAMLRGGVFLPSVPGLPPQNLPQFPADSGFIERAARFSCFSGGHFGEMMNPFSVPDTMNPFSRSLGPMQEVFGGTGSKPLLGMQPQRHEMLTADVSNEGDHGTEWSPLTNDKKIESVTRSRDDSKQGVNAMGNESDEAEFSGRGAQEELDGAAGESSGKGTGSKKRKRTRQDTAEHTENNRSPQLLRENVTDTAETKQKGDQNPTSSGNPGGNNVKQAGSQGSDPPKEDYIHVRARRGQATNSHSLAERVRREKISERMKFLQDLVPGCSKVTGKAVMLDEIINYVQSLQRQVEFLSMKLATVNPRLDFNIEGLLTKDILHPRAGLPSSLAFPPDMSMPFPSLHPSQAALIPAGLQGLGNSSETLRRQINIHSTSMGGGFKESTSQVHGSWEDELHNIVHMGFNSNSSQDLSASLPPGHMKAEP